MNAKPTLRDSFKHGQLAEFRDAYTDINQYIYFSEEFNSASDAHLAYENGELDLVPAALRAHTQNRRFNID